MYEVIKILILYITLPTLDTVTDLNLTYKLYRGAHYCRYVGNRDAFIKCKSDPGSYCSNDENNQTVCRFSSHPKMATALLTSFLLNYIVCSITFLRKEKNKKFTFIFALLNIYPQFGKNNH